MLKYFSAWTFFKCAPEWVEVLVNNATEFKMRPKKGARAFVTRVFQNIIPKLSDNSIA
jgi:hypothetical protein